MWGKYLEMKKEYSNHNLHRRVKWLKSFLDLRSITEGEKNSPEHIKAYFKLNHYAYRKYHSQDGFMHFRISQNGVFSDDDVYYQPDTIADYIHNGDTVVELGCGQGANILYLARTFPKAKFYGFDLMPKKNALPRNVKVFQQNYQNMQQMPDKSVDVVYAIETIVHCTDKMAVFKEVRRILKPGGVFIVYDYGLVQPFEAYDPDVQLAAGLISKGGSAAMIESVDEWASYFDRCKFQCVKRKDLGRECLPDLKRLERKAEKILNNKKRAKIMFSLLPSMFTANIIIGYLGFDACNAGLGTYMEWIYKK